MRYRRLRAWLATVPNWIIGLCIIAALMLLLALVSGCGQRQEPESVTTDGVLMSCGDGVTCTAPCFCERTCILWFCWGKPYCECRS